MYKNNLLFHLIFVVFLACILGILITVNIMYAVYFLALLATTILLQYSIKKPIALYYLLVFFIPFQNYNIGTDFFTISIVNVLIVLLVLILFLRSLIGSNDFSNVKYANYLYTMTFFLLIVACISLFFAIDYKASMRNIVTLAGGLTLFWLPLLLVNNIKEFKIVLLILCASAVFVAICTIFNGIFPDLSPVEFGLVREKYSRPIAGYYLPLARNTGLMATQGSFGIWIFSGLSIAVMNLFFSSFRKSFIVTKSLTILIISIILIGILISQSRNVWLGTIVGLYMIYLFSFISFGKKYFKPLFIIINAILLLSLLPLINNIVQYYTSFQSRNIFSRFDQFQLAFEIFSSYPLFGVGKGFFSSVSPNDLHNTYLSVLIYCGIFGFISLVTIHIGLLFLLFKTIQNVNEKNIKFLLIALIASVISMIVQSQFFPGFADKGMWFITGISACICLKTINESSKLSATA